MVQIIITETSDGTYLIQLEGPTSSMQDCRIRTTPKEVCEVVEGYLSENGTDVKHKEK